MILYPFLLTWSLFRKIYRFLGETFCLSTKAQVIISSLNMNSFSEETTPAEIVYQCPNKIFRIQIFTLEVVSCKFPPKTSKIYVVGAQTPTKSYSFAGHSEFVGSKMLIP